MSPRQIIALFKQRIGVLLLCGFLLSALTFLFLVVSEKNFKASTDFLIVRSQTGSQDYYSLTKSAEYLGKVLGESIYSELFISEAKKTGRMNDEMLPFNESDRLKEWKRIVSINRVPELGIFKVKVLGNKQRDVANISKAISEVLVNNNKTFLGDTQTVEIKVLSGPMVEKNPSIGEMILAVVAGFIFGILLSTVWIYFSGENFLLVRSKNNQPEIDEYVESLKYL